MASVSIARWMLAGARPYKQTNRSYISRGQRGVEAGAHADRVGRKHRRAGCASIGKIAHYGRETLKYIVYENRPNRSATIHRQPCVRVRQHGGISKTTPPTGKYVDAATLEDAESEAKSTGWAVRYCSYCGPASGRRRDA